MLPGQVVLESGGKQCIVNAKRFDFCALCDVLESKVNFIQNMLGAYAVLTQNDDEVACLFDGCDDCISIGTVYISWRIPDFDAVVLQLGAQIVRNILVFGGVADKSGTFFRVLLLDEVV